MEVDAEPFQAAPELEPPPPPTETFKGLPSSSPYKAKLESPKTTRPNTVFALHKSLLLLMEVDLSSSSEEEKPKPRPQIRYLRGPSASCQSRRPSTQLDPKVI